MGRGHDHGVSVADAGSASGKYVRRLILAIGLGLVTFVTQLVVGLSTSSLALLSDSAHVFGVVMALVAILVARPAPRRVDRSYGMYRAEWSRHRNSCRLLPPQPRRARTPCRSKPPAWPNAASGCPGSPTHSG